MSNIYVTSALRNAWRTRVEALTARTRRQFEQHNLTNAIVAAAAPPSEDYIVIANEILPHILPHASTGSSPLSNSVLAVSLLPHMKLMGVDPVHMAPLTFLQGLRTTMTALGERYINVPLGYSAWVWDRPFPFELSAALRERCDTFSYALVNPSQEEDRGRQVFLGTSNQHTTVFTFRSVSISAEHPDVHPRERSRAVAANRTTCLRLEEGASPATYAPCLRPATTEEIESLFETLPENCWLRTTDISGDGYFENIDAYRQYREALLSVAVEATTTPPSPPVPTTGRTTAAVPPAPARNPRNERLTSAERRAAQRRTLFIPSDFETVPQPAAVNLTDVPRTPGVHDEIEYTASATTVDPYAVRLSTVDTAVRQFMASRPIPGASEAESV